MRRSNAESNIRVRLLGDGAGETPVSLGGNWYRITWDGRDDRANENRLLLGGNFRFDAWATLAASGQTCTSCVVTQEVAKPQAGHFCGDWPRASVYSNTPIPVLTTR